MKTWDLLYLNKKADVNVKLTTPAQLDASAER